MVRSHTEGKASSSLPSQYLSSRASRMALIGRRLRGETSKFESFPRTKRNTVSIFDATSVIFLFFLGIGKSSSLRLQRNANPAPPRPNIGNRQRNHAFHPRNGLWPGFGVEEGEFGGCLILITVIADGPNRSAISLTWTSRGHVRSRVVTM